MPYFNGSTVAVLCVFIVYKVLPKAGLSLDLTSSVALAGGVGVLAALATEYGFFPRGEISKEDVPRNLEQADDDNYVQVYMAERQFVPILVFATVFVSFGHGSNDV